MRKFEIPKNVHWLILLVGFAITFATWGSAQRESAKRLHQEFETIVGQVKGRIEKRVQDGRLILRATTSLFTVSNRVERHEFKDYIGAQDLHKNYPGIKSVAFVRLVSAAEKATLPAQAKKEGVEDYKVWPDTKRKWSAPVWYVEPYDSPRVKKALGYDLMSETKRRLAMEKARDTGRPVITDMLEMVADGEGSHKKGFLVFSPIYRDHNPHSTVQQRRKNILGWVHLSFVTDEVIQGLLGESALELQKNFGLLIYFGQDVKERTLVFQSDPQITHASFSKAKYKAEHEIALPGNNFVVMMQGKPAFEARINDTKSTAILIGGAITTTLLTLLVWLLASGRQRAVEIAKKMNLDLAESEQRYRQMFEDNASVAYILDPTNGRIIDANHEAAQFWGYSQEELRRMNIAEINVASATEIENSLKAQKEAKQGMQVYFRHRLKNGSVRDVEIFRTNLTHQGMTYVYCILHDITSRREAETGLIESQARLHVIIETAMDAVIQLDNDGVITDWNTRGERIFGWKRDEAIGKVLVDLVIPASQRLDYETGLRKFIDGEEGNIRHSYFEVEAKHQDGREFPIEVAVTTLANVDGKLQYCAFMHDITDRKRAENALRKARVELENRVFERTAELVRANRRLQNEIVERTEAQEALQESQEMLRQLVAHQDRIRENERRRIAREIHDELGQHLLVLRIDVTMLGRSESEDPKLQEKVQGILQHIDDTMRSVRAIINNLRPSVLDLGLYAALEWQTQEFQRRSGIICDLIAGDEELDLDDNVATVLFRILQEGLTNVLRHAKATHVRVALQQEAGNLIMTIADNGVGMQDSKKGERNSFGLVGIKERLHILGGELNIDSGSHGTRLIVTVPL
ncbi:MAG: PAS domain S-box protein [Oxalobacter sp.]|nr:MAG: PAS domain S-box protein [Oxalobacter sp.]